MARRQSVVSEGSDFKVDQSADWEPEEPIHDVTNIFPIRPVIILDMFPRRGGEESRKHNADSSH